MYIPPHRFTAMILERLGFGDVVMTERFWHQHERKTTRNHLIVVHRGQIVGFCRVLFFLDIPHVHRYESKFCFRYVLRSVATNFVCGANIAEFKVYCGECVEFVMSCIISSYMAKSSLEKHIDLWPCKSLAAKVLTKYPWDLKNHPIEEEIHLNNPPPPCLGLQPFIFQGVIIYTKKCW